MLSDRDGEEGGMERERERERESTPPRQRGESAGRLKRKRDRLGWRAARIRVFLAIAGAR